MLALAVGTLAGCAPQEEAAPASDNEPAAEASEDMGEKLMLLQPHLSSMMQMHL